MSGPELYRPTHATLTTQALDIMVRFDLGNAPKLMKRNSLGLMGVRERRAPHLPLA